MTKTCSRASTNWTVRSLYIQFRFVLSMFKFRDQSLASKFRNPYKKWGPWECCRRGKVLFRLPRHSKWARTVEEASFSMTTLDYGIVRPAQRLLYGIGHAQQSTFADRVHRPKALPILCDSYMCWGTNIVQPSSLPVLEITQGDQWLYLLQTSVPTIIQYLPPKLGGFVEVWPEDESNFVC